jgi:hypothetical protein
MRINEIKSLNDKVQQIKKFARWAIEELEIETEPDIEYGTDMGRVLKQRSFGSTNSGGKIWVHCSNRNAADAMRTLCHELVHHRQFELGIAQDGMDDEQRLEVEDQANAVAGRMMREYGKLDKTIYESANSDLKAQLLKHKKTDYDSIDGMMTAVAKKHSITPKKLHDEWVEEYGVIPDTWIKKQLKNEKIKEDGWKFSKFVLTGDKEHDFNAAYHIRLKRERDENPDIPFRSGMLLASTIRKLAEDKMWESEHPSITDLKNFQKYLTTIDGRSRVTMKPGHSVAVIQFEPHTSLGVIEGRGFKTPKKIADIERNADGKIDYIVFTDGTMFPDAEFVSRGMGGEYEGISTLFFSTYTEADHSITLVNLYIPNSWQLSIVNIKD